jgi:hypothetical protein
MQLRLPFTINSIGIFVGLGWASRHRLKWGPFPPNKVDVIAEHVRKREEKGSKGSKEGMN